VDYVGFAKKTADNSYKIKDLARKGFRFLGEPAASSLLNDNMDVLGKMADEAKSFIRRVTEKYGRMKFLLLTAGEPTRPPYYPSPSRLFEERESSPCKQIRAWSSRRQLLTLNL